MWILISVSVEKVLVSVQDRNTVCAGCNIGSEVILDARDGHLGGEAQVEPRFGPFGNSVSVGIR
jgi:hypothetical protein